MERSRTLAAVGRAHLLSVCNCRLNLVHSCAIERKLKASRSLGNALGNKLNPVGAGGEHERLVAGERDVERDSARFAWRERRA
jgi:hypothetical protein